jgi:hypothetical protein
MVRYYSLFFYNYWLAYNLAWFMSFGSIQE